MNNDLDCYSDFSDWLYDSSDLDAISCYADFDEKTKEWHCSLLDIRFTCIYRCKFCMKCKEPYVKLISKIINEQQERDIKFLKDEQLVGDEQFDDGLDEYEEEEFDEEDDGEL